MPLLHTYRKPLSEYLSEAEVDKTYLPMERGPGPPKASGPLLRGAELGWAGLGVSVALVASCSHGFFFLSFRWGGSNVALFTCCLSLGREVRGLLFFFL
jgi:hypothetical protein